MSTNTRDTGLLQIGWMARLLVALAVLGVIGYDGVAVVVAHVKGEDDAQNAAQAASQAWVATHNVTGAFAAAQQAVAGGNDHILRRGFSIDSDDTVHLLLRRSATTLLMGRIGPLKKYTVVTVHGDENDNAT
jgi:hypothetical protein